LTAVELSLLILYKMIIVYKASTEHQLSLRKINLKLNLYNVFKRDTKKLNFLIKLKILNTDLQLVNIVWGIKAFTLKHGDILSQRLMSIWEFVHCASWMKLVFSFRAHCTMPFVQNFMMKLFTSIVSSKTLISLQNFVLF